MIRCTFTAFTTFTTCLLVLALSAGPYSARADEWSRVKDYRGDLLLRLQSQNSGADKAQLRQVEAEIFRLFNAHNSSDRFDIECRMVRSTGSQIARRVCAPRFMSTAFSRYSHHFRKGFNVLTDPAGVGAESTGDMHQLQLEMTDLIFRSDEFAAAIVRYARLTNIGSDSPSTRLASD